MSKKKLTAQRGFALTELIIATVIALILVSAIGIVVADSQCGWNRMYNRMYADIVTDSYVARTKFDAVIRMASRERLLVDDAGNWIEVHYYADASSTAVDRYARFYYHVGDGPNISTGKLNIEYGTLDPDSIKATLTIQTVCENVSGCVFNKAGRSAQMVLTLDDSSQTANVVSSAVMHN